MLIAIVRELSPSIGQCQLTYLPRQPIDFEAANAQHQRYAALLAELGCQVRLLPAEPDLPDAVFIEDTAVVLDEVAILTRPGAASRRPEVASVARALEAYRPLAFIEPPGTLDGGDVLRVGRTLYAGLSGRSNPAGIAQLAALAAPHGYQVRSLEVQDCLHLKSAVTQVGPGALLINRQWVAAASFDGLSLIDVAPEEPLGGNALLLGRTVVHPAACARTRRRLEAHGYTVRTVELSELEKAEGAVTCCSLIFEQTVPG